MPDTPHDPVQRVVNALTDHGSRVRRQGGEFKATCPAHEDAQASLQIGAGDKGAVLHCHAGCSAADVLAKLNMKPQELFFDYGAKGGKPAVEPEPTKVYEYHDEEGNLLYRVERKVDKEGKKFVQSKPNGKGGWVYQLGQTRRVPYRLAEVIAQVKKGKTVFIVEGEKDVHTLLAHGLVGTTNPGGAGKWNPAFSEHFIGAHVVILPDNDRPGQEHADGVANTLLRSARSVKIVKLPGLPEKGDVTDWFHQGNGNNLTFFNQIIADSPVVPGSVPETFTARELMTEEFGEVIMAVPGVIAEGCTFLVGAPKIGKSWLSLGLGKAVAEGGSALQTIPVEQGEVLYLALEDTPRRLQHRLSCMNNMGPGEAHENLHFACVWPRFPEGLHKIEMWLMAHPKARMILVDTWAKVRAGTSDDGQSMYQNDYAAVSAVKRMADKYACAIVLVHHTRKADDKDPVNTVAGSTGLTGAADATVILARSRGQDEGTLYVTGRDVEESKSVVSFDGETGTWTWLGEAQEVEENRIEQQVIELLEQLGGQPIGPKEVAEMLEMKEGTAKWLLSKMAQEGTIGKIGRGKYVAIDKADATNASGVTVVNLGNGTTATVTQPAIPGSDDDPDADLADPDDEDVLADLEAQFGGDEADEAAEAKEDE